MRFGKVVKSWLPLVIALVALVQPIVTPCLLGLLDDHVPVAYVRPLCASTYLGVVLAAFVVIWMLLRLCRHVRSRHRETIVAAGIVRRLKNAVRTALDKTLTNFLAAVEMLGTEIREEKTKNAANLGVAARSAQRKVRYDLLQSRSDQLRILCRVLGFDESMWHDRLELQAELETIAAILSRRCVRRRFSKPRKCFAAAEARYRELRERAQVHRAQYL